MTEAEDWHQTDDRERETIDRIIKAARDAMHAAGLDARNQRFPFVMHHEFYRTRLRRNGFRPRHADIARLLNQWAREQGSFAEAYAWQAVSGAAASLAGGGKSGLPKELEAECAAACGGFSSFGDWAKALLDSPPGA